MAIKNSKDNVHVLFVSHRGDKEGGGAPKSNYIIGTNLPSYIKPVFCFSSSGYWSEKLKDEGYPVYVIYSKNWITKNADIARFTLRIFINLVAAIRISKIIKQEGIDIVYTNSLAVLEGAIAAKVRGKPHIWHVREILIGNPDLNFMLGSKNCLRIANSLSDTFITISNAVRDSIVQNVDPEKIELIYNSIEMKPQKMTKMKLCECDMSHIGIAGVLSPRKGLHILLDALILENKVSYHLYIAGNIQPNNYKNKMLEKIKLINKKGIHQISHLGFLKDMNDFYKSIETLVVPSTHEGFGLVAIEALSYKLNVIASNEGGLKDIITHKKEGLLVEPNDPQEIVTALRYIKNNPEELKNMALNGRSKVKSEFSSKVMISRIETTITDTIKQKYDF